MESKLASKCFGGRCSTGQELGKIRIQSTNRIGPSSLYNRLSASSLSNQDN